MDYGFFNILTLLGALGLFLYGMKVMSDALMELAGDRMRTILATTTSNRFFAILTGFTITAVIQSSSATTLMVVSFTNASLLTLPEAIGVIMGANIGTTVTAWLISILGFKVSMSTIALPLVGIGFLMSIRPSKQVQHWGYFLIGFSVLFIGLQFLKDSLPDIGNNPELLAILSNYTTMGYASVLIFMVIGTLLTLILQSSSATMAVTLLMTFEGWIPFDLAAAMVLGENIGTTITANLAAIIANYQAKHAARAHLVFNLIGVLWMGVLFYPFLSFIDSLVIKIEGFSPFVHAASIPVALSLFHTLFNIINTSVLLCFVPVIASIVERMVPEVTEITKTVPLAEPKYLNESSLEYSQTGMKALFDESMYLLHHAAYKAITHGMSVHRDDLESDRQLNEILATKEAVSVDIENLYDSIIKPVYSKIVEYATLLQSKFSLDEGKIEIIRNILIANRMLVHVVKKMAPLHDNIIEFMSLDNPYIQEEYNLIRRRILKSIREIHRCNNSDNPLKYLRQLSKEGESDEKLDVLVSGRVNKLLLDKRITSEMASSLLNDSENARKIVRDLVNIATLLYHPKDKFTDRLEDQDDLDEVAA